MGAAPPPAPRSPPARRAVARYLGALREAIVVRMRMQERPGEVSTSPHLEVARHARVADLDHLANGVRRRARERVGAMRWAQSSGATTRTSGAGLTATVPPYARSICLANRWERGA